MICVSVKIIYYDEFKIFFYLKTLFLCVDMKTKTMGKWLYDMVKKIQKIILKVS